MNAFSCGWRAWLRPSAHERLEGSRVSTIMKTGHIRERALMRMDGRPNW
jgi:hypothetical protein